MSSLPCGKCGENITSCSCLIYHTPPRSRKQLQRTTKGEEGINTIRAFRKQSLTIQQGVPLQDPRAPQPPAAREAQQQHQHDRLRQKIINVCASAAANSEQDTSISKQLELILLSDHDDDDELAREWLSGHLAEDLHLLPMWLSVQSFVSQCDALSLDEKRRRVRHMYNTFIATGAEQQVASALTEKTRDAVKSLCDRFPAVDNTSDGGTVVTTGLFGDNSESDDDDVSASVFAEVKKELEVSIGEYLPSFLAPLEREIDETAAVKPVPKSKSDDADAKPAAVKLRSTAARSSKLQWTTEVDDWMEQMTTTELRLSTQNFLQSLTSFDDLHMVAAGDDPIPFKPSFTFSDSELELHVVKLIREAKKPLHEKISAVTQEKRSRHWFTDHLESQYCPEALYLYLEIELFVENYGAMSEEYRMTNVKSIYEKYIKENAPKQVTLTRPAQDGVKSIIHSGKVSTNIFDDVMEEVRVFLWTHLQDFATALEKKETLQVSADLPVLGAGKSPAVRHASRSVSAPPSRVHPSRHVNRHSAPKPLLKDFERKKQLSELIDDPNKPLHSKLLDVTQKKRSREWFTEYLRKKHCAEALYLYLEIELFKENFEQMTGEYRLKNVEALYNKYVKDGAPKQVTLTCEAQDRLKAAVDARKTSLDSFEVIVEELSVFLYTHLRGFGIKLGKKNILGSEVDLKVLEMSKNTIPPDVALKADLISMIQNENGSVSSKLQFLAVHPRAQKWFIDYLGIVYSTEALYLWLEIDLFNQKFKEMAPEFRVNNARSIYDRYIAEKSPKQVVITSTVYEKVTDLFATPTITLAANSFDKVREQLIPMMKELLSAFGKKLQETDISQKMSSSHPKHSDKSDLELKMELVEVVLNSDKSAVEQLYFISRNERSRRWFDDYLQTQYCPEVLHLWVEIDTFNQRYAGMPKDGRLNGVRQIYSKYIVTDAPEQVTLEGKRQSEITSIVIAGEVPPQVFAAITEEVSVLLWSHLKKYVQTIKQKDMMGVTANFALPVFGAKKDVMEKQLVEVIREKGRIFESKMRFILSNVKARDLFADFMASQYSTESMELYISLDKFVSAYNEMSEAKRLSEAQHILKTFIQDDSEKQVTLERSTINDVKEQIAAGSVTRDVFDSVSTELTVFMWGHLRSFAEQLASKK